VGEGKHCLPNSSVKGYPGKIGDARKRLFGSILVLPKEEQTMVKPLGSPEVTGPEVTSG
jgi:hypothetical protein